MRVLLGCEYSGVVREAFKKRGHFAMSCDLKDTEVPGNHYKGDLMDVINDDWDLKICFPPCYDIANSGARWFESKRLSGSQEKSLRFFFEVWKKSNCCENPLGILNGGVYIKKWFPELHREMTLAGFPFKFSQVIQPWEYGHQAQKATCLYLNNLPLLTPTKIVEKGEFYHTPNGNKIGKWISNNKKDRSKTFAGIAEAMADQWSNQ